MTWHPYVPCRELMLQERLQVLTARARIRCKRKVVRALRQHVAATTSMSCKYARANTRTQRASLAVCFEAMQVHVARARRVRRACQMICTWRGAQDAGTLSAVFQAYRQAVLRHVHIRNVLAHIRQKSDKEQVFEAFCCMRKWARECRNAKQDLNDSLMRVSLTCRACTHMYK